MVRQHRRNFSPTLVINLLLWLIFILIVFKLPPGQIFNFQILNFKFTIWPNIILFFLSLSLALTLTLALLFGNTRRGFFLTLFFDGCLFLRLIKQATWLNFILLLGLFLTSEFYFLSREKSKSRPPRKIRR
jgi:hypothetical protein